jgi:hypothetical protein
MSTNLDWTRLGRDLRTSADDAHEGVTPHVTVAYAFLLDNPGCFLADADDEWPEEMPSEPPFDLMAGYYEVPA